VLLQLQLTYVESSQKLNLLIESLVEGGQEDLKSGIYFGWTGFSDGTATRRETTKHTDADIVDGAADGDERLSPTKRAAY